MGTIELKSNIHKLVEDIQSEQLLKAVYEFLRSRKKSKSSKIWDELTEEQKNEVLLAFEETEDEENLIDKKDFFTE